MLLIKTTIGPSKIHGTGLFAAEFIPKGTIFWRFDPKTDEAYTREEAEALPEPKRSDILSLYHTYISKKTGRYVLATGNSKFMNHSDSPNTTSMYNKSSPEDIGITLKDIEPGEEMTIDYNSFAEEGTNF